MTRVPDTGKPGKTSTSSKPDSPAKAKPAKDAPAAPPPLSPEASDTVTRVSVELNKLTPSDAVSVVAALVTRYGWALTPGRTLAFVRAVKTAITALDNVVTDTLKKSVDGAEGAYDGYSIAYQPGRRKTNFDILSEEFPEAYEAAVSEGSAFPVVTVTAKL